jgi:hypothetical protein
MMTEVMKGNEKKKKRGDRELKVKTETLQKGMGGEKKRKREKKIASEGLL